MFNGNSCFCNYSYEGYSKETAKLVLHITTTEKSAKITFKERNLQYLLITRQRRQLAFSAAFCCILSF